MILSATPSSDWVLLFGHVDGAHASSTDLLEQFVRADTSAGTLGHGS